jgi:hypothetical protein
MLFEMLPSIYLIASKKDIEEEDDDSKSSKQSIHSQQIQGEIQQDNWNIIALAVGSSGGGIGSSSYVSTMESISPSSPPSTTKNKLVHSTFRIEEEVIRALARAAEKRGTTLSSLVNKTLKNYVTSEMYFEELGFILVSKNFLRKTFDGLNKKHIGELGKEYGLTIAKEYLSYFYPQVNSSTLISFLEIWFRRFQSCQHWIEENSSSTNNDNTRNKSRHYFIVNHDINMNFSIALQSIVEGLIVPIIRSNVDFKNVSSNAITFSFEVDN